MLQRASTSVKAGVARNTTAVAKRSYSQAKGPAGPGGRSPRPSKAKDYLITASVAAVTFGALWYPVQYVRGNVHNDADPIAEARARRLASSGLGNGVLTALVWGSNRSGVLSPDTPAVENLRTPSGAPWSENVALRDLALHETHAACVDARGDIYQWGDGFFGPSVKDRKPVLTLRGKNIVQIQLTESRVLALSASGRVYVLSSDASKQTLPSGAPSPSSRTWWSTGWMWGEEGNSVDFVEITPREPLGWNEKFVSISAGSDHMLALTSSGSTYAYPITSRANSHGQLGFRKFDIPSPAPFSPTSSATTRLPVELTPKSIADPYAKASPFIRKSTPGDSQSQNVADAVVDDSDIRFSDTLFEIQALKGVKVSQIATGGRSSFVKTDTGRVLGWGANEYGQIGLGSNVTLNTITVPTEVVFSRLVSNRTRSQCLDICAGGDLTSFTVERTDENAGKTIELLMCGNGRWGGLGNNQFTNAQGSPLRVKNISGLQEFSDKTQTLQPIAPHAISISPSGHVLLTLGTGGGRDLIGWGANYDSQLGNGRKSSVPSPANLALPDGERLMLARARADVRDLAGRVWKRGVEVEQCAVAGYGNSVVYWRIR